ncbi:MAG: hypothetical protein U5K77_01580 [Candidatus Saccharibacteria bacterium]|nr:hypothetical protein [Candidatus Saccharibacteria bacterium]
MVEAILDTSVIDVEDEIIRWITEPKRVDTKLPVCSTLIQMHAVNGEC